MRTQRERASLRIHRLRQLAKALVEHVRERKGSSGNLTQRPIRGCKTFVQAIDARPEGFVSSNVGNDKSAGIGCRGFGAKKVERILKAARERLVRR